jgi:endonuclease III
MSKRAVRYVYEVAEELRSQYHDFDHNNKKNPLDELLFIICSIKTSDKSYESTYKDLKRAFPTFLMISEAPAEYIAKPLEPGGLYNQKSNAIKNILETIIEHFRKPTLAPLKRMSDAECESFLTMLPGVGKKVARCVMLYSLGREVFPVDTHCWRICRRLGWIRSTRPDRSCSPKDMDRLQFKIPNNLRFSLHVNMVSLGRHICTAHDPKCTDCPILLYCRQVGLRKSSPRKPKFGCSNHEGRGVLL